MVAQNVLRLFPPHIHPLTLVHDPDGLLGSEATRLELARRGFSIIQEDDPLLLRRRVAEAVLSSVEHPLLIISSRPLETLPYDLWQPGYRIELSLHQYFPNLAYPVLQTLSPSQLGVLTQVSQPDEPLGRQKTIEFLLKAIFDAGPAQLSLRHQLIAWLMHYHQVCSPMPPLLRDFLLERLKRVQAFRDWNLAELINDPEAFSTFLQNQWTLYVQTGGQDTLGEGRGKYQAIFETDQHLQEMVSSLVRKQVIRPVEVPTGKAGFPKWAADGLTERSVRDEQIQLLIEDLTQKLPTLNEENWETWKQVANQWAELSALMNSPNEPSAKARKESFRVLGQDIDRSFQTWLKNHYALLGAQRLPRPAHVHHIPHYLAYQRSLDSFHPAPRLALIILDGMSLADWTVIQSRWGQRNPHWQIHTDLLLAQIPTITSLSRYALISGLRPSDFAKSLDSLPSEEKKWRLFWTNEALPQNAIGFAHLSLDRSESPDEIGSPRLQVLCLIDDTLDQLTHNATLGAADQQASLSLWLDSAHTPNSAALETLISQLLDRQFTVFLSSDHGHVEATGFGYPSEGLVAQTRGKRARMYQDRYAAQQVQTGFAETILWENDGLNPPDQFSLMPSQRKAFAPNGEVVVTHGGVSLDEVVVPFIRIEKKA